MRRWFCLMVMTTPLITWAQAPAVCGLLSAKDIAAATQTSVGKLTPDESGTLTRAQVPGLPTSLRFDQCAGTVRLSGAVPLRVGLLRAERSLSAAEWGVVEKALEDPAEKAPHPPAQKLAGATCWQHSWRAKQQLHEVVCTRTKGHWHLTIGFEHEDPKLLPGQAAVADLAAKALAALP